MENYFVYNDPIRIVWRKGNSEEPYVDKVESQKIINSMVVLTEIPDEFTHVSISGYTEIYEGTPSTNQFIVNYENGIITFNTAKEGVMVSNMTYKGRGFILYPASRIYGRNANPDVTVTLQQIIDKGEEALDALSRLIVAIANAEAATANAITQGNYAKAQGNYAKDAGDALTFKGTYSATTKYVIRNMVYYNGSTFMATADTTGNLPTAGTHWKKIGNMVYKGTYGSAVAYTYGDFVVDATNYNLYMSISETNTGQLLTNATYWAKMISVQTVVDAVVLATTNANTATTQANNARDAANTAKTNADAATTKANTATTSANTATTQANAARDAANTAAAAANTAKTQADTARDGANTARDAANVATSAADAATGRANTATNAANAATGYANTATSQANTARDAANVAKTQADTARDAANTAKTNADVATGKANTATGLADAATANANTKANYAQAQGDYAKDVGDSLTHRGDYSATTAYIPRNLVYYNGVTYMCIANSAAGVLPTTTNWKKISAFNWKGTYSTAVTYQFGDFVVDPTNQRLYICVKDGTLNTALTTVANWNVIFDISAVISSANTATSQANTARDGANAAKASADTATGLANTATTQANAARDAANTAKSNADTATSNANTQATYAKTQGDYAKAKGDEASVATGLANTATSQANTARDGANAAKASADTATSAANTATGLANTATAAANAAKTNADVATGLANTATTNANNAANNANTVANRTTAKGVYSASITYYPNNIVTYNGSSYICIVQALNKVPTDTGFWQLVALKGNDGLGTLSNIVSTNNDIAISGSANIPDLAINASLKALWNDKYTKTEVNTLINQVSSNIQWKTSVATYSAIATTYPNPQDGWTVNVNDTDYTYRYTGSAWIAISANSIPNASPSADGKMTSGDYSKLAGISARSNRTEYYAVNGQITIDGTPITVYNHPTGAGNNHIPSGGAANNFLKYSASGVAVWSTPTLVDLADTTIASPTSSQVLRHNGSRWVNANLTYDDIRNGTSTALATNFNADMVDGFHLNQDVRSTAMPSFAGVNLSQEGIIMGANANSPTDIGDIIFKNYQGVQKARIWTSPTGEEGLSFTSSADNTPRLRIMENGSLIGTTSILDDLQGNSTFRTVKSTVPKGTAPLIVASDTLVPNLNAQFIEGYDIAHLRQGRTKNKHQFIVNGDADTYYPVTINVPSNNLGFNEIGISRGFAWAAPNTWNNETHKGGLTFNFKWSGDIGWGGNDKSIRVIEFNESYSTMVAGMHLSVSRLIVWLRGGGALYEIQSEAGPYIDVAINYDGYTALDKAVYMPRTDVTKVAAEIHERYPVRGETRVYVKNKEVFHPGNMGSGSLLDADTVDGLQPSSSNSPNTIMARDATSNVGLNVLYLYAPLGTAPLVVTSNTVVSNLNADMVDGFHLNQDVRTTAIPTFNSAVLKGGTGLVLKRDGAKSWVIHKPTGDSLNIAASGSVNGEDWDWIRQIVLSETGVVKATSYISTVTTGTSPLAVVSTTLVANFNADMVDGYHSSMNAEFYTIATRNGSGNLHAQSFVANVAQGTASFYTTSTTVNANFNADLLDGQHGAYYAPIASPLFTGVPLAPTAVAGTNSMQIATTAFVDNNYGKIVNPQNWRSATDAPSTYPQGRTMFFNNNVPGFPSTYGSVVTIKSHVSSSHGATQYFYPYNVDAPIKFRHAFQGVDAWTAWRDIIDSTATSLSSIARTIPVRDNTKKIAEVSATRADVSQLAMTVVNAPVTIASFAPTVKANFTVYFYMTVTAACTVEVKVTYSDKGAANSQTIYIQESKTMTPDSYGYVPIYLTAIPTGSINVVVTTSNASATLVSATIKEE